MINWEKTANWLITNLLILVKAAAILIVGHFIIKFIIKIMNKSLVKAHLDLSLEKFIVKTVNVSLHIIVILSAITALGISTAGLLAALSAAAVGIALALKDSLSSVAGGIMLLISPRFKTGDFVEIAGESGTVMQIDLIHTTLKTLDNRHVVIPNSSIINNQIVDFSSEEKRRVDLVFSIGYNDDVELAKKLILETVGKNPLAINNPEPPFIRVSEYADSAVNITTRVWCESKNFWQLRFDLLEQVRKSFDENGVTIPYNQLDVHIVNN